MNDKTTTEEILEPFRDAMFHAFLIIFIGTILLIKDGATSLIVTADAVALAVYLKRYNALKSQLTSEEQLYFELVEAEKKERRKWLFIIFCVCLCSSVSCYIFNIYFNIKLMYAVVFLGESIFFFVSFLISYIVKLFKK